MLGYFLLLLLGDKDHEKILGIVAKVEKKQQTSIPTNATVHARRSCAQHSNVRCYDCGKFGHISENCFKRRREPAGTGGNRADVQPRLLPKLRTIINEHLSDFGSQGTRNCCI